MAKINMVKQLKPFFLIFSLICYIPCYAQFSGRILEIESDNPIQNANISFSTGKGASSEVDGTFELSITDFPVILKISHVAYHPREIIIESQVQSGLIIHLTPKTTDLGMVEVRGERIKRYYQNNFFYVVDYDFIEENICLIGYENNNLARGRILLLSPSEDTLAYFAEDHPKRLYRDAFDNLHLITRDSVYQLYYENSNLYHLYPGHREEIPLDLFLLKLVKGSRFLFKNVSELGQTHEYYFVDTVTNLREDLKTIYNEDLYKSADQAGRASDPRERIPGRGTARSIEQALAMRRVYERLVYEYAVVKFPVNSYVYKCGSGFIIVDLMNGQIHHYNDQFELDKTVKTNLPKHKQRQKLLAQDPNTQQLYWIYYRGSRVLLGEIDPDTGEIINTLETPSFPFIENIKIRNGIIWFTYQPRLGETVRSLYRML